MAENGNISRALESGSETLYNHECTQCRAHGSRQEATDLCQTCKELMCNICQKYHSQYMKTHTSINVGTLDQSQILAATTTTRPAVAKCHYHPDQDIEMYCGTHDMVYCCRCIAKEHRSCSDVNEIEDIAHKPNLSTLQSLITNITRISTRLNTTKIEWESDLNLLQKKTDSLLEAITAAREKCNEHLDALEKKIKAELDEKRKMLKKEIADDIKVVDDLIITSDKRRSELSSQFDEKQIYITEKLGQCFIADANTFLKKANILKHSTLKFEQNDALFSGIEKSNRLGNITECDAESNRSNYSVKSINETNVRVKSDKSICCIRRMCQLPDGTIILIDENNKQLKRLDDLLKVKDVLAMKTKPVGLCPVSPTEVAIRLNDNTIEFISVGKSLSFQRKISIKHPEKNFYGLACCAKQFWIPGPRAVYVYSLTGDLVKKIETEVRGQDRRIFHAWNPLRIDVSNDGSKVYVTAWEDRVVVFNANGDVIDELRDHRLDGTSGICITDDDKVLVAGFDSENVVMFDSDGNSLGELISSKDISSEPRSLCYDRKKCRLLVGYTSDTVQLFQITK